MFSKWFFRLILLVLVAPVMFLTALICLVSLGLFNPLRNKYSPMLIFNNLICKKI